MTTMTTMKTDTPHALLETFFAAFNRSDLETLVGLYEPNATLVAQPGMVADGATAIREALGGFLAMKPRMTRETSQILIAGDTALALTRWTLDGTGPDGAAVRMNGEATDVFRRQPSGQWRVAVDNPWG